VVQASPISENAVNVNINISTAPSLIPPNVAASEDGSVVEEEYTRASVNYYRRRLHSQ
jgi:hypothetical protein